MYGIPADEMAIQSREAEDISLYGYEKGEMCNRYGCKGVIYEHEHQSGGCSCHIHPPCSYCTENVAYCSECNWDSQDEQDEKNERNKPNPEQLLKWEKERKEYERKRNRHKI